MALAIGASSSSHEYGGYLSKLREQIYERLAYPAPAKRRGLTGTVLLDITVRSTGAIQAVTVVSSSSHTALDEAAVAAVRTLPPLPFPVGVAPRTLVARLPIVFELKAAR